MLQYETYIFRPNPKKRKDDLLYITYIFLAGIVEFIFYLLHIPGIGLFAGAGLIVTLFKLKMEQDRKKGARRLGHLIDKLVIREHSITFGSQTVTTDDLKNVLIYADDFEGKSKQIIGTSNGTDNNIEFEYHGNKYSFQFKVKLESDLKFIHQIAAVIEKSTAFKKQTPSTLR